MTALSIQPTFPTFTGADGQPLENGYIWVGTANLNPITNPITVYWDAALSAPATQPIRTLCGYPSNSGTPARLYVNSDYSIQVLDRKGSVVYSAPVATDRYGGGIINANIVVYDPSGTGAVATTVQAKLRERVSVKDFGAVGDGVTDDTAAIQAAIDATSAWSLVTVGGGSVIVGGGSVFFPNTTAGYKVTASLKITNSKLLLRGPAKLIVSAGVSAFVFNYSGSANKSWCQFRDLDITGGAIGIDVGTNTIAMPASIYNCKFVNQTTAGVSLAANGYSVTIRDSVFSGCTFGVYSTGAAADGLLVDHCVFDTNSNYDIYFTQNNVFNITNNIFVLNTKTPANAANIVVSMGTSQAIGSYSTISNNKFGQEGRTGGNCIRFLGTAGAVLNAVVIENNLFHFDATAVSAYAILLDAVAANGLIVRKNSLVYCRPISYGASLTGANNGQNQVDSNVFITNEYPEQLLRGNNSIVNYIEPKTVAKTSVLKWSRYINSGGDFTYTNATPSYMTAVDEDGVANSATTITATAANNVIRYNVLSTNNTQIFYTLSIWVKLTVAGNVTLQASRGTDYAFNRTILIGTTFSRITIPFYQTYLASGSPYTFDMIIPNGGVLTVGSVCCVPGSDAGDLIAADTIKERAGLGIYGTAIPGAGIMPWAIATIIKNSAPAVGSPKGWVCTVAGNPGTWVSEGNL